MDDDAHDKDLSLTGTGTGTCDDAAASTSGADADADDNKEGDEGRKDGSWIEGWGWWIKIEGRLVKWWRKKG